MEIYELNRRTSTIDPNGFKQGLENESWGGAMNGYGSARRSQTIGEETVNWRPGLVDWPASSFYILTGREVVFSLTVYWSWCMSPLADAPPGYQELRIGPWISRNCVTYDDDSLSEAPVSIPRSYISIGIVPRPARLSISDAGPWHITFPCPSSMQ